MKALSIIGIVYFSLLLIALTIAACINYHDVKFDGNLLFSILIILILMYGLAHSIVNLIRVNKPMSIIALCMYSIIILIGITSVVYSVFSTAPLEVKGYGMSELIIFFLYGFIYSIVSIAKANKYNNRKNSTISY